MIDTHAHLYMCKTPIETLISRANAAGVTDFIHVSVDLESAKEILDIYRLHPSAHPTVGLYPGSVPENLETAKAELDAIVQFAKESPVKAIGEIGLDYYKVTVPRPLQLLAFERQLQLAQDLDLPVIVHNRESDDDILALLAQFPKVTAVIHCFSSDKKFVEKIISPTRFFSFTCMITYHSATAILDTLPAIPMSQIMLETDCPYLSPATLRGKENEPASVRFVRDKIAEIKGLSPEEVDQQSTQTAKTFFKL